jgi:glycosyltransferase involved in cell wall biosynthesis
LSGTADQTPALSVIVPASNEQGLIGPCLDALATSDGPVRAEVIVVANGCHDGTVAEARSRAAAFAARGWSLRVLDLPEGGKPGALNAGEAEARGPVLAYLDADVTVSPPLMRQIAEALARSAPAYGSGTCRIAPARSAVTRAYGRTYARVPFMTHSVPGCGLFAMNRAGRARWQDWPAIISDDTFARLQFSPPERIGVPAPYHWPLVEGFGALVRVRRRQDRGVAELRRLYPALEANDDKPRLSIGGKLRLALRDPIGFAVYVAVALAVRLGAGNNEWVRGR